MIVKALGWLVIGFLVSTLVAMVGMDDRSQREGMALWVAVIVLAWAVLSAFAWMMEL